MLADFQGFHSLAEVIWECSPVQHTLLASLSWCSPHAFSWALKSGSHDLKWAPFYDVQILLHFSGPILWLWLWQRLPLIQLVVSGLSVCPWSNWAASLNPGLTGRAFRSLFTNLQSSLITLQFACADLSLFQFARFWEQQSRFRGERPSPIKSHLRSICLHQYWQLVRFHEDTWPFAHA